MAHGTFSGDPRTVWLTQDGTEDREMRVIERFAFTDPKDRVWEAPADAIVNGASIPRALWSVVGSPYTGDYRRASIVHDVACREAGENRTKRRAADRMFFHACRAGGCSTWQAVVLYLGVRLGAAARRVPAWQAAVAAESAGPRLRRTESELQLERDFQTFAEDVLAQGETDEPRELERRADRALARTQASRRSQAGKPRRAAKGYRRPLK
ncbi:MAG: DUF1353 domain-containing protein [Vicinamibacterales bacterium]